MEMDWMKRTNPNLVLVDFHLLSGKSVSTGRWFGALVPYLKGLNPALFSRLMIPLVTYVKLDGKILRASNVPTALGSCSKVWMEEHCSTVTVTCRVAEDYIQGNPPHLSSLGCCSANWGINQAE